MSEDVGQIQGPPDQFFSSEPLITCFSSSLIRYDEVLAWEEASKEVVWEGKEPRHLAFIFIFLGPSLPVAVNILYKEKGTISFTRATS